ncbi:MAG: HAMP domain-containing sensor histidine kinase [Acidimicrobiia bacterium]
MTEAPPAGHRLGLRWRVSVVFAGLALLVSAGLAIFSYELTRTYLLDRRVSGARREAFTNARAVRDALRVNPADVRGALAQAQTGSGSVVVQSGSGWFGTSVGVGRAEVPLSLRRLVAAGSAGTQYTTVASQPSIAVGLPLPAVNAAYFELDTTRDLDQTLVLLAQALAVAAAVVTAIGAVLGWYAAGRVLRPVRRMAATAGGISEGALGERLDAEGDSDLEPLVDSFNAMVDALRTRIEREARFASDVSHELRTPLATMASALNVARRHRANDTRVATDAALDVLGEELDRFTLLVQDLLEISRLDAGVEAAHRTNEAPAQLVQEVLVSTHREHVRVELDSSAPKLVDLNKRRIGQVLTNLLNNADAYGGGATTVVVAGTATSLLLAVDDAGPGIPPEERERMFERFARGSWSDATPGTGLGLALAVEHLRLHDGRVWVDDSPDGGARFVIEVPRWST